MDYVEPKMYLAYSVDFSGLHPKSEHMHLINLLKFGNENPLFNSPPEQDYGMPRLPYDQFETQGYLKKIFDLQLEDILPKGVFFFYSSSEKLFKPYPKNPSLAKIEVPFSRDLAIQIYENLDNLFMHFVSLNGRNISEDAGYLELSKNLDIMAKDFHMQPDYNKSPETGRIWFTDVTANMVQQSQVYLMHLYDFLPNLNAISKHPDKPDSV